MKNDQTISASEVNRYLYCNYQWYYEHKYGMAELRRRKKIHMDEIGITPTTDSPLQKGLVFHARFERRRRFRLALRLLRIAVVTGIFLYILLLCGVMT
ncbi:MAG: PD-(D/E)XK nuclease family protein [Defluviitaleaceae bacterium]|nr:PD-(D/E)XK nuclease family protein [Defluviitaleaceae bacterium]